MFVSELIGFTASVIVLIQFLLDGEKRIRCVSMIACMIFIVYGVLITAPSIIFLNISVFIVHIYKLRRLSKVYSVNLKNELTQEELDALQSEREQLTKEDKLLGLSREI